MVSVTRTVNITFKGVQRWKKGDVLHIDEHEDAICVDVVNGHGIFLTTIEDFEHFDFDFYYDSKTNVLRKIKKFCKDYFLDRLPEELSEEIIPLGNVGFKSGLFRIPTKAEVEKYANEIEKNEMFSLVYLAEDYTVESGAGLFPWSVDFMEDYFDALTVIFCVE
jgi:hypothetical protein